MRKLLIALLFLTASCATVDLRPATPPTTADREAGRALLRELADAHGGRDAWLRKGAVRVEMRDQWKPMMHAFFGPWPKNGTPFELTFFAGEANGRIRFLEADEPDWGLQNWVSYTVAGDGDPVFEDDFDIKFWIPTASYFVEAPFRVLEATTVYRMEPKDVAGRRFERVFATWETEDPDEIVDQYVVWIDAETKRLGWLEYTIRDYGDWMKGVMAYEELVEVDGFLLAKEMGTVAEPGGKRTLHRFYVSEFELGASVPRSRIVPEPRRAARKY